MANDLYRQRVEALLKEADVVVGGSRDTDLQVHDARLYARLLAQGSLGLGESYMEGWWDAQSLDGLLHKVMLARLDEKVHGLGEIRDALFARLFNPQTRSRSREVGERHYDLGNDLYAAMLGKRLVYSCGYWRDDDNLDGAQEAKLDLVCRKLQLKPGMRVLDIGCGWGEALKYAAERYGVSGVGVTISKEQAEYARVLCNGLPVEIRLQDYRDIGEKFDAVFSIGMFEHVGVKNYRTYFDVARRCLPDEGLFLLHTIATNVSDNRTDPWIAKYIFPNSMLPSALQIAQASEGKFMIEDWHNFGTDYDKTLQAWRANAEAAWDRLDARYDERFRRMWRFYLAGSMATFRSRRSQLWQLVLSPRGVPGGYIAPLNLRPVNNGVHAMASLYDFSAKDIDGNAQSLAQYAGKAVLVVNVASKCGFTPQYEGLEQLWREYKDKGLVVLGFPCDQFGHQEPGDEAQIKDFCSLSYEVTFPMFAKIEVNGDGAHPLYQWLKRQKGGVLGSAIKWNFSKFLIGRDGQVSERYATLTKPEALRADIEKALA